MNESLELNGSVTVSLLKLFDSLSREFHNLNNNHEKIALQLSELNTADPEIKNIKELVSDMNHQIPVINQLSEQAQTMLSELTAYKNRFVDVPQHVIDNLDSIIKKLEHFDADYFNSIKDIQEMKDQLEPLSKIAKYLAKPLGVILAFLIFTVGILGSQYLILKIAKMFAPDKSAATQVQPKKIGAQTPPSLGSHYFYTNFGKGV